MARVFNFSAGPAALPLPVLEEIQAGFLDFGGSGMSVTEVSHRSKWFDDVINDTVDRFRRLLPAALLVQAVLLGGCSVYSASSGRVVPSDWASSARSRWTGSTLGLPAPPAVRTAAETASWLLVVSWSVMSLSVCSCRAPAQRPGGACQRRLPR